MARINLTTPITDTFPVVKLDDLWQYDSSAGIFRFHAQLVDARGEAVRAVEQRVFEVALSQAVRDQLHDHVLGKFQALAPAKLAGTRVP